jgi:hypothetical protein
MGALWQSELTPAQGARRAGSSSMGRGSDVTGLRHCTARGRNYYISLPVDATWLLACSCQCPSGRCATAKLGVTGRLTVVGRLARARLLLRRRPQAASEALLQAPPRRVGLRRDPRARRLALLPSFLPPAVSPSALRAFRRQAGDARRVGRGVLGRLDPRRVDEVVDAVVPRRDDQIEAAQPRPRP